VTRTARAVAGVAAAGLGTAAGQVLGTLLDPASAPLQAVGATVIDLAPAGLKEWAISTVGTADKPLLVLTVVVALCVVGAVAGIGSARRTLTGDLLFAGLGLLGVLAALTRPDATLLDALPSVLAAAVAIGVLRWQSRWAEPGDAGPELRRGFDRRLLLTGGAGLLGVLATANLPAARGGAPTTTPITIPRPKSPAPAFPTGLERTVAGVSPLRTPVPDFYRVDTALFVPGLETDQWRLEVTGMVANPFAISWDELLAMPMIERDITLTCVSNEIGGPYCGSTRWIGVRVADLLARAQPSPGAEQVLSTSSDGFTASTPLPVLLDGRDAMVAIAMDGQPLTREHGFPARLLTPGLYGYVGATKWLTQLKLTTFAADEAYWTARGWAEQAPVKTATRIDTPHGSVNAGTIAVAGVAWATHRGISRVQVQVDDGPWQDARLGPDVGLDYWRQWYLPWDATSGRHRLSARAYDGAGVPQTAQVQGVLPDGATGYHVIEVQVG
jgi:DMSO/TMAO reductase YedYZ molybdopterin-dependent catalytic subunit